METSEKIRNFLTGLAQISATAYQIRTQGGGLLYATHNDTAAAFTPEMFDQITSQIIENNAFKYDAIEPPNFLCGCPLANGDKDKAALLAYGSMINGIEPQKHRRQFETHLDQTVALIEENRSYRNEIEELAKQLELSFEDLYLYSQISDQLKSLTLSRQMLNNIMMKIVENTHVEAAFIYLFQRPQYDMEIYPPVSQPGPENWEHFLYHLQILAQSKLAAAGENYIIINDSRSDPAYQKLADLPYRFLLVGVRDQNELYGWIGMTSFNMQEIFRQGELRMLKSLAEQLAIVIANTDLYRNLEKFTESMVRSLVHAIEAKDPYTRGHSERVHHFTMLMAAQLRLKNDDFETLKWAAILHDIGKIGISEKILLKPGKLDDEEFSVIKSHPEKGGRILQPVAQLAGSLDGIVHHHERYDGKGYPHGLKAEAIPLPARIIAVADTFDAITSNRTYRKAKSPEEAMQIIRSVSGTQLDPAIVKIFEKIYTQEPLKDVEDFG